MAVDSYLIVDGRSGPSTSKAGAIDILSNAPGSAQTQPATVQLGEQTMGQVASRLGIPLDQLQQANPNITDPSNLKAGQEIQLPSNTNPPSQQSEQTEGAHHHHHHHHHNPELPNAPLGSSIEASMTKAKLDAMSGKKED